MRFFTTIAAFALAASVSAQSATSTTASLSPQQTCLGACDKADICCQAACVGVPCPDAGQVNATTECAGQCPQGNGTEAETNAYAACQSSCISSYFLTATSGTAATRSSGAAATATGASATGSQAGTSTHASGTASNTASGTASGSSASATGNSAPNTRVALAGAGLFGLLIAGLAL